jgi:hypothetical protein
MGEYWLTTEEALRQLGECTDQLRQAALAGDFRTIESILARREAIAGTLRAAVEEGYLDAVQRRRLEQVVGRGAETQQILAARREALRADLARLESQRGRLGAWAPVTPETEGTGWSA